MHNGFFVLKAYSIALVTLGAGVTLSLNLMDWSWFSRSGALVVVNGIILTSHQILEHMRTLGQLQRLHDPQSSRDWASRDRRSFVNDDVLFRLVSEKHGLYMLIFGTLIWGFGDLVGLLFLH